MLHRPDKHLRPKYSRNYLDTSFLFVFGPEKVNVESCPPNHFLKKIPVKHIINFFWPKFVIYSYNIDGINNFEPEVLHY